MAPWVGIVVPVGTPREIVRRLSEATLAVMRKPEVIKLLTEQQVTVMALGGDEFGQLIRSDLGKWERVIKTAGIKAE
jgi:tripartite-type tricarboxylate transporter receptor subunit TctC